MRLASGVWRPIMRMPRGESQLDEAPAQARLVELGARRPEEGVDAVHDTQPVVRVAVVGVGAPHEHVGARALRFRPLLGLCGYDGLVGGTHAH